MNAVHSGPLTLGRVIAGRYELISVLGEGTTGTVYLAKDRRVVEQAEKDAEEDEVFVALKVIHLELCGDRQIFGRFHREAKILKRVEGAHLVKLLEFMEEDGLLVIVLEYVEGPSLEQYIDEAGPLPCAEAVAIAAHVCAALQTVHDAGIIHRDLKPANVLLGPVEGDEQDVESDDEPDQSPTSTRTGRTVKMVDFGLAKVVAGEQLGTALTEQDMVFGTPAYMSPEQVLGEEMDARSDIYALGIILYEMVIGDVPFDKPTPVATMTAHLNEPVPELSKVAPAAVIDPKLLKCIHKALAKRPNQRFRSATHMLQALFAVYDGGDITSFDLIDPAIEDTQLDGVGADSALNTTLQSARDTALEAAQSPAAKIQVEIRDAVSTPELEPPRESERPSDPVTPSGLSEAIFERRFWTLAALFAALVAVAVGIYYGVR